MFMYYTVCNENNDTIDAFETEKEAREEIKRYEEDDKRNGIFEDDFYDVLEVEFISKV